MKNIFNCKSILKNSYYKRNLENIYKNVFPVFFFKFRLGTYFVLLFNRRFEISNVQFVNCVILLRVKYDFSLYKIGNF